MNDLWLLGLAGAILFFVLVERFACRHPERQNTLSHAIYQLGQSFPLSILIMGMLAGGIAVHLFWHWCPDGGIGIG